MSCVPLQNNLVYSTLSIRAQYIRGYYHNGNLSNNANILFTNGNFFNLTLPNVYTGMAVGHVI